MTKPTSKFRLWLQNIWFDNCDEHDSFGELPFTMEEYFNRYKYWLKREFKFQQRQERIKENEITIAVDPNFVINAVLDDKLDSNGAKLLSKSQDKLIKTLKDKNEK